MTSEGLLTEASQPALGLEGETVVSDGSVHVETAAVVGENVIETGPAGPVKGAVPL